MWVAYFTPPGWTNLPCVATALRLGLILRVKCGIIYIIDTIKFPVDLGQYTLNALGYILYYIDKKQRSFNIMINAKLEVGIPPAVKDKFQRYTEKQGMSMSGYLRMMIMKIVNEEDEKLERERNEKNGD